MKTKNDYASSSVGTSDSNHLQLIKMITEMGLITYVAAIYQLFSTSSYG